MCHVRIILINLFHRDDLAKFLFHCTWGKDASGWSIQEELTKFETLMYRPVARLVAIQAPKNSYASIYAPDQQWQLQIDLPPLVKKGDKLGLQITRTPMSTGAINMAGSPKLVNEQNGKWQRLEQDGRHLLRYSVAAGGTIKDIVALLLQMPLYLWASTQRDNPDATCHLYYGGYSSVGGVIHLEVQDSTTAKGVRAVEVTK
ncbi:hypothetical protein [Vibrio aerogenes]|uniref:hypothetical protein n=1 Tax=Vibrio aerogenes TaxID=92172 RepID=UPI0021C36CF6|nr:hypothetical protein [Vibrio aerogenes]